MRLECLRLIGQLSHVTGDSESSLAILEEYCNDEDPRVRTAAFEALVRTSCQKKCCYGYCTYIFSFISVVNASEGICAAPLSVLQSMCTLHTMYRLFKSWLDSLINSSPTQSAKALQDDSEDVRLVAVKLVCALGLLYGGK